MEKLELNATLRSKDEKASTLRENKRVPAVVYGHKQEALSLSIDASDLLRAHRKAGESQIISLIIDGKEIEVLIHDFQQHPVSWSFTHVDFFAVTRWEKLTTKIHLEFIWTSNAAKEWAIIEEVTKELEVKCLPKDLVAHFDVDLSQLKEIWDSIKVSDLSIDSKFEILTNADDIVVHATKPKVKTEDTTTTEIEEETKES